MAITKALFGQTKKGEDVHIYTITNQANNSVALLTYGGIIQTLNVADKAGQIDNVVLGFNTVKEYEELSPFFGTITGRFAGRISGASFDIDGTKYPLPNNFLDKHTLHGGNDGLDKKVYQATIVDDNTLSLNHLSKDMSEGFPGNLDVTVIYTWTEDNALVIEYKATTDKKTYLTLTNHTYFNLSSDFTKPATDQALMIASDHFVGVTDEAIPCEMIQTAGTPFDFRTPKAFGKDIEADYQQLKNGCGYDHPFKLDQDVDVNASLYDPKTGRYMTCETTEDFVVCYTANHLSTSDYVYDKVPLVPRAAICLETQNCPDHMHFEPVDDVVYGPDKAYYSKTTFKFSTK